ncbi:MAG TPA: Asp23/Gls24 family envelope stress response protein [Planctomycetota bacterium]|nr:Asp23/Gls24 family envelope stress response protein [Planctomycetota bacterium]
MIQHSASPQGGAIPGRLTYAQPVLDKMARHATSGIEGLRMEPPGSGNLLERFLLHRLVLPSGRRHLRMEVYLQAARGWQIPDLCRRAQAAIAEEVGRLTHYERITVNVHVSGTFGPGDAEDLL